MEKRKVGHPTDYRPEYCKMLVEHMAKGLSFESFAGVVKTTFKTLYNWEKQNPEFLQAKEEGKSQALLFWESLGIEGIYSISETTRQGNKMENFSKALNSTVYRLNMANRFGWRENKEVVEKTTEKRLIIKKKDSKEDE